MKPRIWDWGTADPAASVKVLHGHEHAIDDLAISSSGRWLVTANRDRTVRI